MSDPNEWCWFNSTRLVIDGNTVC